MGSAQMDELRRITTAGISDPRLRALITARLDQGAREYARDDVQPILATDPARLLEEALEELEDCLIYLAVADDNLSPDYRVGPVIRQLLAMAHGQIAQTAAVLPVSRGR
jgi:hypothetical protein